MRLLPESAQLHGGSAGLAEPVGDLAARREERARARTDAIFATYGAEVERVCRGLLRNAADAEDAKQQTFLSAYRALLGGTEPRDVPAWLATIARHECYRQSAARKQAAVPAVAIEEAPDLADVHTQAVANLSAARLRREIRRLPSLQRDAIILREFAGLSYDELARELGVTRPAAHSLLVRARTTLRGRLRTKIAAVNLAAAIASCPEAPRSPRLAERHGRGLGRHEGGGDHDRRHRGDRRRGRRRARAHEVRARRHARRRRRRDRREQIAARGGRRSRTARGADPPSGRSPCRARRARRRAGGGRRHVRRTALVAPPPRASEEPPPPPRRRQRPRPRRSRRRLHPRLPRRARSPLRARTRAPPPPGRPRHGSSPPTRPPRRPRATRRRARRRP